MVGPIDLSLHYQQTQFVCVFHGGTAYVTVVRGWTPLAAAFAPHFAFIGTHGETNVERAARTLEKLPWDRDENGEIAFLTHEFTSGVEAYVTVLRAHCIPIEAADWIWRADDLDTPFASLDALAETLWPGEPVEIAGGLDTRPAWVVRDFSNGKPKLSAFRTHGEADALSAALRQRGAAR